MFLDITSLMDIVFRQGTSFAGTSALDRGNQSKVLVRMRQILRVTRIFRLMRLVKLFQQYLVCSITSITSVGSAQLHQLDYYWVSQLKPDPQLFKVLCAHLRRTVTTGLSRKKVASQRPANFQTWTGGF
jgi:hypothetical protein